MICKCTGRLLKKFGFKEGQFLHAPECPLREMSFEEIKNYNKQKIKDLYRIKNERNNAKTYTSNSGTI